ncbi:hypothetical protein CRENBAI_023806 [Crenichthys baileyi]|uniref:Uncharacterized protein n=1 Tax=Crenichthys baileyi TaxID=28760 RepID=A0AAV9S9R0_9TELE
MNSNLHPLSRRSLLFEGEKTVEHQIHSRISPLHPEAFTDRRTIVSLRTAGHPSLRSYFCKDTTTNVRSCSRARTVGARNGRRICSSAGAAAVGHQSFIISINKNNHC